MQLNFLMKEFLINRKIFFSPKNLCKKIYNYKQIYFIFYISHSLENI